MKNKELSITPTKKPQSPLFDLEAFQLFIEFLSKGNSSKNVPFSIRFYSHEWHTAATHSLPIGGTGWHVSSLPDNQQIWQHPNYNTVYHNFYHQMQFVGISDILNLFGGWTPKSCSTSLTPPKKLNLRKLSFYSSLPYGGVVGGFYNPASTNCSQMLFMPLMDGWPFCFSMSCSSMSCTL